MNRPPVVKVCGVTEETEVEILRRLGVHFFGLVVEAPSPFALSAERAKQLASLQSPATQATLVTGVHDTERLTSMIQQIGSYTLQLGVRSSPDTVAKLQSRFAQKDLTIIQELPYRNGRFLKGDQAEKFVDAGADFILLDKLEKTGGGAQNDGPIDMEDLHRFRSEHPEIPLLIAGSVTSVNAAELLDASGAVGVDVCTSVRREGSICEQLVAELMERIANNNQRGLTAD